MLIEVHDVLILGRLFLSGLPLNHFDGNGGVLCHQRLLHLHLSSHFLQLLEGLLELFACGRVLGAGSDELDGIEFCLIVQVVKQLYDVVQFVEIVDLDLALFQLGKRGQGAHGTGTNLVDLICQHVAKRWDRLCLDC